MLQNYFFQQHEQHACTLVINFNDSVQLYSTGGTEVTLQQNETLPQRKMSNRFELTPGLM